MDRRPQRRPHEARLETVRPEEAGAPLLRRPPPRKTLEAVEWGTDIDLEALLPIDPHMPEEIQRLESDLLRSMAERAAPDAAVARRIGARLAA